MTEGKRETWKNAGRGPVYVLKFDRFGNEQHEGVPGGKTFSLTADERLLNQDRAAANDLDVFSNGTLTPVRFADDETAAEMANNPNLMTDADLRGLFSLHWKSFQTKVGDMSNAIVLHRLLEVAEEADATVKQLDTIRARIAEVDPTSPREVEVQQVGSINDPESGARPVTPK